MLYHPVYLKGIDDNHFDNLRGYRFVKNLFYGIITFVFIGK